MATNFVSHQSLPGRDRAQGEPIHLVAVEFSANERNVVGFEVETA